MFVYVVHFMLDYTKIILFILAKITKHYLLLEIISQTIFFYYIFIKKKCLIASY